LNKLVHAIEAARQKFPRLRRDPTKETPTRTIVIDPLLEALGWDVRDPDEVHLEYPTIDGKSVDYALKLNQRPVLLVEAKAIGDPLEDVKAITQVVGYAANNGIVWCVLTNGVKWQVYRSMEKCPAPDKLMFEVSLDPAESDGMSIEQVAAKLWRLSREETVKGTLDAIGEQTFTDGKVRKALQSLMADPPSPFLKLVRRMANDENLSPKRIKQSLARIAEKAGANEPKVIVAPVSKHARREGRVRISPEVEGASSSRRAKKGTSTRDESHHLAGKPQEVVSLFRGLERLCLSLAPGEIGRTYRDTSINFRHQGRSFCSAKLVRSDLRVFLRLKYARLVNPPGFARDVTSIGHHGTGDLELRITSQEEFDGATDLVRQSFEGVARGG
jgi:hypothetical protein